jgi:hypothetical protein
MTARDMRVPARLATHGTRNMTRSTTVGRCVLRRLWLSFAKHRSDFHLIVSRPAKHRDMVP